MKLIFLHKVEFFSECSYDFEIIVVEKNSRLFLSVIQNLVIKIYLKLTIKIFLKLKNHDLWKKGIGLIRTKLKNIWLHQFLNIYDMADFLHIFVLSWSTEIIIFFLYKSINYIRENVFHMYVTYIDYNSHLFWQRNAICIFSKDIVFIDGVWYIKVEGNQNFWTCIPPKRNYALCWQDSASI